jgi:16S rRNA processing protein RimM
VNQENASLAKKIVLGHISGVHGIKGWVKIHSHTEPRVAIFDYQPWLLGESGTAIEVLESKVSGKMLLALLKDVNTREEAEVLAGQNIAVGRDRLPPLQDSEFYWADLIGLRVLNHDGVVLGQIKDMLATGANDVMVVSGDRERLIPFVMGVYVSQVDLVLGFIKVDWDSGF